MVNPASALEKLQEIDYLCTNNDDLDTFQPNIAEVSIGDVLDIEYVQWQFIEVHRCFKYSEKTCKYTLHKRSKYENY